ncbi:MAG: MBOAT family O-acyltransferase [Planctomycetota bacterium]|nr:MBOAT family O-acyltransferase [Planctomycetota bacterium]
MLFVELRFLAFFGLVLAVSWALRRNRARKAWLLLASYAFYAAWDWRFLGLILLSTVVDGVAGRRIHAAGDEEAPRRAWLCVSLAVNLGILVTYKYFDFFAGSLNGLLTWLGVGSSLPVLNLVLPVGISFYTFQTLSYSLDIYRRQLAPARSALDLALFVAFFPQLVAGPIVLAKEFLPQLAERARWSSVDARAALVLFFVGFVKKSCFSDALSPYVDAVHLAPEAVTTAGAWLSAAAFAAQIYCDFSGYTDMAIACAALLGYTLPTNFRAPYLTRSVGSFWTHWHITLGRWFREYLYFPLGGNRRGPARSALNLFLVFLVSGLWHGAAWTFVLWGSIHGAFVALERTRLGHRLTRLPMVPALVYVNLVWMVSMVIFRAPDLDGATTLLGTMFTHLGPASDALPIPPWLGPCLVGAFAVHILWQRLQVSRRWAALPAPIFGLTMGVAVAVALPWVTANPAPYIYFAF